MKSFAVSGRIVYLCGADIAALIQKKAHREKEWKNEKNDFINVCCRCGAVFAMRTLTSRYHSVLMTLATGHIK